MGEEVLTAVFAIGVPAIALMIVLACYFLRKGVKVKVIKITNPILLVGYEIDTTEEKFHEDDEALWNKYKDRRATIENRKEAFSNLSIKKKTGEDTWHYSIGTIVNDYSQAPADLTKFEVPSGLYAFVRFRANDVNTWRKKKERIEKHMIEQWIPESEYDLDYSTNAFEMEYHDKRDAENTRIIVLYFAVKPKPKAAAAV